MTDQMQRGEKGVDQSIEIFMPQGRQVNQRNTTIGFSRMALPAVNGDGVPALYQTRGQLFSESFEAAISSRNPPRAENGDASHLLDSAACLPLLSSRRFGPGQGARPRFGLIGWTAHGIVAEPAGDIIV